VTVLALTSCPNPAAVDLTAAGETLGELVRRQAARDAQAYVEAARHGRVLTFGELERWRRAFAEGTCAPGTTVALSVDDSVQCAAALVAAVAAGLWVAPLDPATPADGPSGLAALTRRVGAEVLITDRPTSGVTLAACPAVPVASLALRARATALGDPAPTTTGAGGIVLSSSGTTGPPKVVRLGQAKLLHAAHSVVAHHALSEQDRGFNPLPLFHVNAEVVGLLSSLVAGACLVLDDRFHRTDFWTVMERRRVTWINAVPAIISRLAEVRPGETVPAGIRFVRSASAPLPVATADRFEVATGLPIVETYGMTEAASQITAHPLSVPRRAGSVGLPVGLELRVVRDEGDDKVGRGDRATAATPEECPAGEVGQVEIRGASVIDAYEGGGHADRFRPGGWLRTGDLGRRDEDGYLYLVARTDDVINRGGEKVFPREIEEIISADPAVATVAVVGRDDPELGQVPVAFVVLRGVHDPGGTDHAGHADHAGPADHADHAARVTARLSEALARHLVRTKRPAALHVVPSLPSGATGKVRRRALREAETPVLLTVACV
jgi:acyl-CoA synthetase (AMP-forming)/AMP-acid ligase II